MSNSNTQLVPATNGSLSGLAREINEHHAAFDARSKVVLTAIDHAYAAGDKLIQAKSLVPHGQWGKWLADNVSFSERTAQAYMRLANGRAELETKSAETADLTIDAAIKLLAAPKPKFATPDLKSDQIFFALGEGNTIAQIEQSTPGYHYVTTLNMETGEIVETKRAINLGIVTLPVVLSVRGFVQCDEWQSCERDDAPIPLIDETVRFEAYLATLHGTYKGREWKPSKTWGEAMEAAGAA